METKRSKIMENHYQSIKEELLRLPCQLTMEELMRIIRKIVSDELQRLKQVENRMPEPEFLSVKEAANFLNLAVTTMYEKTSLKQIPFHKRDKKLYFKKEELTEWLLGKWNKSEAQILKLPIPKKNRKAA